MYYKGMQALIYSDLKLDSVSFSYSTYQVKEKLNISKNASRFKFYQKLFVILLTSCSLLIIPESPKDSELLCKKYHSKEACNVW